jgi:Helix-turn-helix domain
MVSQPVESLALRPREAAKSLGISARTLWGLTAPRGPIPCLRVGHGKRQSVLYPVADLRAWLSRQEFVGPLPGARRPTSEPVNGR